MIPFVCADLDFYNRWVIAQDSISPVGMLACMIMSHADEKASVHMISLVYVF